MIKSILLPAVLMVAVATTMRAQDDKPSSTTHTSSITVGDKMYVVHTWVSADGRRSQTRVTEIGDLPTWDEFVGFWKEVRCTSHHQRLAKELRGFERATTERQRAKEANDVENWRARTERACRGISVASVPLPSPLNSIRESPEGPSGGVAEATARPHRP